MSTPTFELDRPPAAFIATLEVDSHLSGCVAEIISRFIPVNCSKALRCGLIASLGQGAVIAVLLWIESVIEPALNVVGGMKPRTNANENAGVDTNPLSTLPKSWPTSAAAAGKTATQ